MIRELHIYDFDATLFMSPMHPNDWEGHIGSWYDTLRSLSSPCVIDPPDDLWIESTVQDALASIADPNVYAVLMTGRSRRADLVARIMELIAMRGLSFDEVHLKPGGGTLPWKSSMIEDFVSKMPDLQAIQIWEDRENHLQSFVELIESLGLEAVPHFVNVMLDTPCDLSGEPSSEPVLREYVRELLEASRPPDSVSARPGDVQKAKSAMEDIMSAERSGAVWTFNEISLEVRTAMGRRNARAAIKPALKALIDEKKIGYEGGTTRAFYWIEQGY